MHSFELQPDRHKHLAPHSCHYDWLLHRSVALGQQPRVHQGNAKWEDGLERVMELNVRFRPWTLNFHCSLVRIRLAESAQSLFLLPVRCLQYGGNYWNHEAFLPWAKAVVGRQSYYRDLLQWLVWKPWEPYSDTYGYDNCGLARPERKDWCRQHLSIHLAVPGNNTRCALGSLLLSLRPCCGSTQPGPDAIWSNACLLVRLDCGQSSEGAANGTGAVDH